MSCLSTEKKIQTLIASGFLISLSCMTPRALAYPEFQAFVEKNSRRTANCAMCHSNPEGPGGNQKGQVGGLSEEEKQLLGKARQAMEPGQAVDNPLLNEFGNRIIERLGRRKFIELKGNPQELARQLGDKGDIDGDGIADASEYLDGTDPLNQQHGDPAKLFLINLDRYKAHVVLAIIAVFLLEYGIAHWLKGIDALKRAKSESEESQ